MPAQSSEERRCFQDGSSDSVYGDNEAEDEEVISVKIPRHVRRGSHQDENGEIKRKQNRLLYQRYPGLRRGKFQGNLSGSNDISATANHSYNQLPLPSLDSDYNNLCNYRSKLHALLRQDAQPSDGSISNGTQHQHSMRATSAHLVQEMLLSSVVAPSPRGMGTAGCYGYRGRNRSSDHLCANWDDGVSDKTCCAASHRSSLTRSDESEPKQFRRRSIPRRNSFVKSSRAGDCGRSRKCCRYCYCPCHSSRCRSNSRNPSTVSSSSASAIAETAVLFKDSQFLIAKSALLISEVLQAREPHQIVAKLGPTLAGSLALQCDCLKQVKLPVRYRSIALKCGPGTVNFGKQWQEA